MIRSKLITRLLPILRENQYWKDWFLSIINNLADVANLHLDLSDEVDVITDSEITYDGSGNPTSIRVHKDRFANVTGLQFFNLCVAKWDGTAWTPVTTWTSSDTVRIQTIENRTIPYWFNRYIQGHLPDIPIQSRYQLLRFLYLNHVPFCPETEPFQVKHEVLHQVYQFKELYNAGGLYHYWAALPEGSIIDGKLIDAVKVGTVTANDLVIRNNELYFNSATQLDPNDVQISHDVKVASISMQDHNCFVITPDVTYDDSVLPASITLAGVALSKGSESTSQPTAGSYNYSSGNIYVNSSDFALQLRTRTGSTNSWLSINDADLYQSSDYSVVTGYVTGSLSSGTTINGLRINGTAVQTYSGSTSAPAALNGTTLKYPDASLSEKFTASKTSWSNPNYYVLFIIDKSVTTFPQVGNTIFTYIEHTSGITTVEYKGVKQFGFNDRIISTQTRDNLQSITQSFSEDGGYITSLTLDHVVPSNVSVYEFAIITDGVYTPATVESFQNATINLFTETAVIINDTTQIYKLQPRVSDLFFGQASQLTQEALCKTNPFDTALHFNEYYEVTYISSDGTSFSDTYSGPGGNTYTPTTTVPVTSIIDHWEVYTDTSRTTLVETLPAIPDTMVFTNNYCYYAVVRNACYDITFVHGTGTVAHNIVGEVRQSVGLVDSVIRNSTIFIYGDFDSDYVYGNITVTIPAFSSTPQIYSWQNLSSRVIGGVTHYGIELSVSSNMTVQIDSRELFDITYRAYGINTAQSYQDVADATIVTNQSVRSPLPDGTYLTARVQQDASSIYYNEYEFSSFNGGGSTFSQYIHADTTVQANFYVRAYLTNYVNVNNSRFSGDIITCGKWYSTSSSTFTDLTDHTIPVEGWQRLSNDTPACPRFTFVCTYPYSAQWTSGWQGFTCVAPDGTSSVLAATHTYYHYRIVSPSLVDVWEEFNASHASRYDKVRVFYAGTPTAYSGFALAGTTTICPTFTTTPLPVSLSTPATAGGSTRVYTDAGTITPGSSGTAYPGERIRIWTNVYSRYSFDGIQIYGTINDVEQLLTTIYGENAYYTVTGKHESGGSLYTVSSYRILPVFSLVAQTTLTVTVQDTSSGYNPGPGLKYFYQWSGTLIVDGQTVNISGSKDSNTQTFTFNVYPGSSFNWSFGHHNTTSPVWGGTAMWYYTSRVTRPSNWSSNQFTYDSGVYQTAVGVVTGAATMTIFINVAEMVTCTIKGQTFQSSLPPSFKIRVDTAHSQFPSDVFTPTSNNWYTYSGTDWLTFYGYTGQRIPFEFADSGGSMTYYYCEYRSSTGSGLVGDTLYEKSFSVVLMGTTYNRFVIRTVEKKALMFIPVDQDGNRISELDNCFTPASGSVYPALSYVDIYANPTDAYTFLRWEIVKSTGSNITTTVNYSNPAHVMVSQSSTTYRAVFADTGACTFTGEIADYPDAGIITGLGSYFDGKSVQVSFNASTGYHFEYWTVGAQTYYDQSLTVQADHDMHFVAHVSVVQDPFTITLTSDSDTDSASFTLREVSSSGADLDKEPRTLVAGSTTNYNSGTYLNISFSSSTYDCLGYFNSQGQQITNPIPVSTGEVRAQVCRRGHSIET